MKIETPYLLFLGSATDHLTVKIANSIVDDGVVGTITSNGANTFREAAVDGAVAGDRLGVTADELFGAWLDEAAERSRGSAGT